MPSIDPNDCSSGQRPVPVFELGSNPYKEVALFFCVLAAPKHISTNRLDLCVRSLTHLVLDRFDLFDCAVSVRRPARGIID